MASTMVETENKKMRKSTKEMGPHQTYILLHSKGNRKQKRQTTDWEKSFANDVTLAGDKGLISKYMKSSYNSIIKTGNPIKEWAEDLNRHFSKEGLHRSHRHVRRYSIAIFIFLIN